jgi:DNA-binding XRE family transcriptional regulator
VNDTGTKQVRIMKQTAYKKEKNGEYTPYLKYSVLIFVE